MMTKFHPEIEQYIIETFGEETLGKTVSNEDICFNCKKPVAPSPSFLLFGLCEDCARLAFEESPD